MELEENQKDEAIKESNLNRLWNGDRSEFEVCNTCFQEGNVYGIKTKGYSVTPTYIHMISDGYTMCSCPTFVRHGFTCAK
mgnify:CR=1 FL=1